MKTAHKTDSLLNNIKHIHMIGIGGSGMYPLAEILNAKGYLVTGSDNNENEATKRLSTLGVKVYKGQKEENVHGAELIVFSAAVHEDNPERVEAKKLGIPQMERSFLLGALTRKYDNVIAVAGTHGKTTVTSMITQILYLNKMDPTSVIGGKLPLVNSYCTIGKSQNFVCESCEFVDSFLQFSPDISVLLNVDNDHLDYFGTMENLEKSFAKFVSFSKLCYVYGGDNRAMNVVKQTGVDFVTYGFENCKYTARNLAPESHGFAFDIYKEKEKICRAELSLPGRHNVLNALVSFAVCYEMGVSAEGITEALKTFTGAGRRFEVYGTFGGITVVDDYGHHPTEIEATIKAARDQGAKRIIIAFQPFTYSRVANLKEGMIKSLSLADKIYLTPIVASREENIWGVSSEQIAEKLGGEVIDDYELLAEKMINDANKGDIIITMGAGDIYKAAHIIAEKLKNENR